MQIYRVVNIDNPEDFTDQIYQNLADAMIAAETEIEDELNEAIGDAIVIAWQMNDSNNYDAWRIILSSPDGPFAAVLLKFEIKVLELIQSS